MWAYPIELTKDSNGTFLVTCRDWPEVTTFGVDRGDASKRALDAIEEALGALGKTMTIAVADSER